VQDLLYEVGGGATRARGGQSCHNHTVGGEPASWAADVWDGGLSLGLMVGDHEALAAQVPFLHALGVAARAEGLAWGGDWSRRAPWSELGLGWDPAHLEDRRCAGR